MNPISPAFWIHKLKNTREKGCYEVWCFDYNDDGEDRGHTSEDGDRFFTLWGAKQRAKQLTQETGDPHRVVFVHYLKEYQPK